MPLALEPDSHERHRSVPIRDTITRIPGYPRKLVIFKIPASSYWWVRYYAESHIFKRTTKTEIKRDALEAAKRFYDDITIRIRGGNFEGLPLEVNAAEVVTFAKSTNMLMDSELAKLNRSQLSKITYDNMQLRYDKHILPFFGQTDVLSINYKMLDEFLQKLSNQVPKLSVSTLGAYMGLTRKVLQHAARHSFIQHIPEFPKVTAAIPRIVKAWRSAKSFLGPRITSHADGSTWASTRPLPERPRNLQASGWSGALTPRKSRAHTFANPEASSHLLTA